MHLPGFGPLLAGVLSAAAVTGTAFAAGETLSFNFVHNRDTTPVAGLTEENVGLQPVKASDWMDITLLDGMVAGSRPTGLLTIQPTWKDAVDATQDDLMYGYTSLFLCGREANTGTWHTTPAADTATAKILSGFLDDYTSKDHAGIRLENIPYSSYKVYVYFNTDGDGFKSYKINGAWYKGDKTAGTTVPAQPNEAWGETTSRDAFAVGVNTLCVEDLSGDLTVETDGGTAQINGTGRYRGTIAGLQVVNTGRIIPPKTCEKRTDSATVTFSACFGADVQEPLGPSDHFVLTLPSGGTLTLDVPFRGATLKVITTDSGPVTLVPGEGIDTQIGVLDLSQTGITQANQPSNDVLTALDSRITFRRIVRAVKPHSNVFCPLRVIGETVCENFPAQYGFDTRFEALHLTSWNPDGLPPIFSVPTGCALYLDSTGAARYIGEIALNGGTLTTKGAQQMWFGGRNRASLTLQDGAVADCSSVTQDGGNKGVLIGYNGTGCSLNLWDGTLKAPNTSVVFWSANAAANLWNGRLIARGLRDSNGSLTSFEMDSPSVLEIGAGGIADMGTEAIRITGGTIRATESMTVAESLAVTAYLYPMPSEPAPVPPTLQAAPGKIMTVTGTITGTEPLTIGGDGNTGIVRIANDATNQYAGTFKIAEGAVLDIIITNPLQSMTLPVTEGPGTVRLVDAVGNILATGSGSTYTPPTEADRRTVEYTGTKQIVTLKDIFAETAEIPKLATLKLPAGTILNVTDPADWPQGLIQATPICPGDFTLASDPDNPSFGHALPVDLKNIGGKFSFGMGADHVLTAEEAESMENLLGFAVVGGTTAVDVPFTKVIATADLPIRVIGADAVLDLKGNQNKDRLPAGAVVAASEGGTVRLGGVNPFSDTLPPSFTLKDATLESVGQGGGHVKIHSVTSGGTSAIRFTGSGKCYGSEGLVFHSADSKLAVTDGTTTLEYAPGASADNLLTATHALNVDVAENAELLTKVRVQTKAPITKTGRGNWTMARNGFGTNGNTAPVTVSEGSLTLSAEGRDFWTTAPITVEPGAELRLPEDKAVQQQGAIALTVNGTLSAAGSVAGSLVLGENAVLKLSAADKPLRIGIGTEAKGALTLPKKLAVRLPSWPEAAESVPVIVFDNGSEIPAELPAVTVFPGDASVPDSAAYTLKADGTSLVLTRAAQEPFVMDADSQVAYTSLQEAFDAAAAAHPDDIALVLTADASGEGLVIPANTVGTVTLLLNGFTYTFTGADGIRIEDSESRGTPYFEIDGGTLNVASDTLTSAVDAGVGALLVLKNVTVDTRQAPSVTEAVRASSAFVNVLGSSSVLAADGRTALAFATKEPKDFINGYATIDTTGTIGGTLTFGSRDGVMLELLNGTFTGPVSYTGGIMEIRGGTFEQAVTADVGAERLHLSIHGGRFRVKPDATLLAEGCMAFPGEDGVYTVRALLPSPADPSKPTPEEKQANPAYWLNASVADSISSRVSAQMIKQGIAQPATKIVYRLDTVPGSPETSVNRGDTSDDALMTRIAESLLLFTDILRVEDLGDGTVRATVGYRFGISDLTVRPDGTVAVEVSLLPGSEGMPQPDYSSNGGLRLCLTAEKNGTKKTLVSSLYYRNQKPANPLILTHRSDDESSDLGPLTLDDIRGATLSVEYTDMRQ